MSPQNFLHALVSLGVHLATLYGVLVLVCWIVGEDGPE